MKRGFTLVELLVTIVILAVLASMIIPQFTKAKERALANQAATHLRAIRLAELMYHSKANAYLACNNETDIKNNLGIEVQSSQVGDNTSDKYFFTVVTSGSGFSAIARKGAAPGSCGDSDTICLDQSDSPPGGTSSYKPDL